MEKESKAVSKRDRQKQIGVSGRMNQILRLIKRAVVYYKREGFCSFTKAALVYLLKKYRLKIYQHYPLLKIKSDGQRKRIFYIDYFSPTNSNYYWLRAFQRFGKVEMFDIVKEKQALLRERIMKFKPVHIHLGGSVKDYIVSPQFLSDIKKGLGCSISVFYGDSIYSFYHYELAKVVNYIYISNKTHIKKNEKKGLKNFKYMPCPTDPYIFKHYKSSKIYDVIFIGNNNQVSRLGVLKKLTKLFNLKVFGTGWEKTGLNSGNAVYGKEFSKVCSKAKIVIGILDTKWTNLEAYFSNRLVNTLATGSFYIQRYTPGLEKVFTNREHLVWYTSENELIELIKYYLINEKEREEIAAEGQREVYRKYIYEMSIKRILKEAEQKGGGEIALGLRICTLKWIY